MSETPEANKPDFRNGFSMHDLSDGTSKFMRVRIAAPALVVRPPIEKGRARLHIIPSRALESQNVTVWTYASIDLWNLNCRGDTDA